LCTSLTSVSLDGVINIGQYAFYFCTSLTNVAIGSGVTTIGDYAFTFCTSLTSLHFQGGAPTLGGTNVFGDGNHATTYYLPGTTGWSTNYGGIPTALWTLPYPLILNGTPPFGVESNGFGFTVSWATNLSVVVEASPDLANPKWSALATNTLSGGIFHFSDPQWTNYPSQFYRIRSL
jgi:hypothetical protein